MHVQSPLQSPLNYASVAQSSLNQNSKNLKQSFDLGFNEFVKHSHNLTGSVTGSVRALYELC